MPGIWVHWLGDAVSLVLVILALAVSWGKVDQRLTNVESQQKDEHQQAIADRRELKLDIQRELQNVNASLIALDAKLTTIIMNSKK